jgi:hypothetical protein
MIHGSAITRARAVVAVRPTLYHSFHNSLGVNPSRSRPIVGTVVVALVMGTLTQQVGGPGSSYRCSRRSWTFAVENKKQACAVFSLVSSVMSESSLSSYD